MSRTSDRSPAGGHIAGLDGLRGVAILSVMTYHFCSVIGPAGPAEEAVLKIIASGWCGVDLFFVLSGFLITGILLDSKGAENYFSAFYARRTVRIFPLYYGVLAVVFGVLPRVFPFDPPGLRTIQENQGWLWTYTTNFGFIYNRKAMFNSDWLGLNHFWSLAIEEQFYLIWPLIVYLSSRRVLACICLALIAEAFALRTVMAAMEMRPGAVYFPTPCRVDSLATGSLVAVVVRVRGYTPGGARAAAVVLVAGLFVAAGWIVFRGGLLTTDRVVQTVGYSVIALMAASGIYLTACPYLNPLQTAMHASALRFLGKYSYGMYVFHHLIIIPMDLYLPVRTFESVVPGRAVAVAGFLAVAYCSTLAASIISWHLWEAPFLRLKKRFPYRMFGAENHARVDSPPIPSATKYQ